MNKYISLLPVSLVAFCIMAACTTTSSDKGCTIKGHTTFNEYRKAYLMSLDRALLDSMSISEGNFHFDVADSSVTAPYALFVRLSSGIDSLGNLDMPVFVENGSVSLEIGEYVYTSGTPLNDRMQDFLDALQHCKDGLVAQKELSIEEIEKTFSEFYCQQILTNKDNALGRYIYHEYGIHLNDADRELVKAQLVNL